MKTPIEQLIEVVERSKKDQPQPHFWKHEVLELLDLALQKEKEFIKEVYWEGGQEVPQHWNTVDNWYDKTFNDEGNT